MAPVHGRMFPERSGFSAPVFSQLSVPRRFHATPGFFNGLVAFSAAMARVAAFCVVFRAWGVLSLPEVEFRMGISRGPSCSCVAAGTPAAHSPCRWRMLRDPRFAGRHCVHRGDAEGAEEPGKIQDGDFRRVVFGLRGSRNASRWLASSTEKASGSKAPPTHSSISPCSGCFGLASTFRRS